jgi:hypothetical protein
LEWDVHLSARETLLGGEPVLDPKVLLLLATGALLLLNGLFARLGASKKHDQEV